VDPPPGSRSIDVLKTTSRPVNLALGAPKQLAFVRASPSPRRKQGTRPSETVSLDFGAPVFRAVLEDSAADNFALNIVGCPARRGRALEERPSSNAGSRTCPGPWPPSWWSPNRLFLLKREPTASSATLDVNSTFDSPRGRSGLTHTWVLDCRRPKHLVPAAEVEAIGLGLAEKDEPSPAAPPPSGQIARATSGASLAQSLPVLLGDHHRDAPIAAPRPSISVAVRPLATRLRSRESPVAEALPAIDNTSAARPSFGLPARASKEATTQRGRKAAAENATRRRATGHQGHVPVSLAPPKQFVVGAGPFS